MNSLVNEIWKDVVVDKEEKDKYKGLYQVSNTGKVRSLIRTRRILKPGIDKQGYKQVTLSCNGKTKQYKVHRLVLLAFDYNSYFEEAEVNHKDENPSNNNLDNIQWCTGKYNCNYNNHCKNISKSNKGRKLTYEQCKAISIRTRGKYMGELNPAFGTQNFTKLKSDIENIWNNIKTALTNIWETIRNTAVNCWTKLKEAVLNFCTSIKEGSESIWDNIKTSLANIWEAIKNAAVNAWTKLKETVISLCGSIKEGVINLWNSILSWFSELPGKLYSCGSSMFTKMKEGISSTIGSVKSSIESGINSALSYLASLPSKAWKYGADFVNGIVNGIRSAAGKVTDAVSALAAKIRSYLHFSVPDEGPLTDYESWMPDFMSGLAEGINKSKSVVSETIRGLSLDMKVNTKASVEVPDNNNFKQSPNVSSSGFTLHIENFINNTDKDIEQLAYELEFYRRKISMGKGGV